MKKELRLPTIIGLLVAVVGLVAGLVLVGIEVRRSASASAEEIPVDVRITNLSDSSFTVSWTTSVAASGFVKYGLLGEQPDLVVSDERDLIEGSIGNYFTHYVTVRGLSPEQSYAFSIGSGKGTYDQEGNLYQIKTGATISSAPAADVAYGQVNTATGDPAAGVIVYVNMAGAAPLSALAKTSGSWVVPLATARTPALDAYVTYDRQTTNLQIEAVDGQGGVSRIGTTTAEDSPLTLLTLGQDMAPVSQLTPIPTEDVVAETPSEDGSKLSGEVGEIMLLNPKFGEKSEMRPEIIGKAPANTQVTIEVHSQNVIQTTVVSDADGNFAFDVPTDLAPGEHTVTVTAVINGVTKKITRSFVVLAADESFGPEFSASPSAIPTATTKPASPTPTTRPGTTPTIAPTATITATVAPSPTALPTIMPETTDDQLPVTGESDWTWLILGAGAVFVLGGMAVLAL